MISVAPLVDVSRRPRSHINNETVQRFGTLHAKLNCFWESEKFLIAATKFQIAN